MEPFHVMLPEDEIFLCGMVLLYGVVAGFVLRAVVLWMKGRSA
jgi:hypothetical protein